MLDLILAVAHHLLVFALAGLLAMEAGLVSARITVGEVRKLARIDVGYAALATSIIAVGLLRVMFAAKGWSYYVHNHFFWAKMGTFLVIGLLSIWPTMSFVRWQRAAVVDGSLPSPAQIRTVQRFLWLEIVLFGFLLLFAAAMARGYGVA